MITARGAKILLKWIVKEYPDTDRMGHLRMASNKARIDVFTFIDLLEGRRDSAQCADDKKNSEARRAFDGEVC